MGEGYTFGNAEHDDDYNAAVGEAEDHWHAARDDFSDRVAEWSSMTPASAFTFLFNRPGRP